MEAAPNPFAVLNTVGQARRGRLTTRTGTIETPVFMPVGTLGLVKGLDAADLQQLGAKITLANAYHLMLRPGADVVAEMGGLHGFTGSHGSFLTDSGGFQVFSLASSRKVTDEGVTFRSHIDGARIELTPERLCAVQQQLGPDIAMVLDECPPGQASRATIEDAMRRTTLWAERCLRARTREDLAWFGIVQGGVHEDLRSRHVDAIAQLPFHGYAIGGVSVGEATADIERIVRHTAPRLPAERARYLMGVGTPEDLVRGVAAGVDMFDCIMPSRNARNGQLFTSRGRVNIKASANRRDGGQIDPACPCPTCRTCSRAYLRHLFVARELSYFRYATLHNVSFYLRLMARLRAALEDGTFDEQAQLAQLAGDGGA
jgi:queuine tRNA-ribosyltransferase